MSTHERETRVPPTSLAWDPGYRDGVYTRRPAPRSAVIHRTVGVAAVALGLSVPTLSLASVADASVGTPRYDGTVALPKPARISSGTSPGGVRWSMDGTISGATLQLDTWLPEADGSGAALTVPWRSRDRLDFGIGSGLGRADEWSIDGLTFRTVDRLRVTTAVGTTVTFRPRRAPRSAVRRYPKLALYRYFIRFFPTDQRPLVVTALSPGGRVIAQQQATQPDDPPMTQPGPILGS